MKKFKIGVIGTGMRTMFLMNEILKREELEVVAVCDINQESLNMITDNYKVSWDQYKDYKELLAREDIEGVIIASPDYCHEEQAIAAFEAGKHIFLEKPVAITVEGAKKVLKKRDESGKTLLVGFVLRYNKLYKKMKELIESGVIGELKTGWILHSVGAGSDWYFHDWHGLMENTGGLLLQKGSHDFDIINWIVDSKVKRVAAMGSRDFFKGDKPNELVCEKCSERNNCGEAIKEKWMSWKTPNGNQTNLLYNIWRNKCVYRQEVDVPDNHQVLLEYENGVKISYLECHYTPDDNREYIFIGTKGKLKLDDANDTITIQIRNGMYDRKEKIVYENLQSSEGHGGGDKYILDDFVYALETGKQPNAGGEAGYYAIEAGLAAHKAINDGEIVIL
ncbi:Gfo/Idh/MocA family oxidoreductase [Clostridium swellfunianum]|uniref:Gfo/Idh/MocA family protein n=1 Tax=Clostridium swellfunianum TaxID=1367462 RepID=UPI00202F2AC8|nr:Gfo/Idh/MocA family oxidoreductase [Clostridium swellfunianum]MCM0646990.1 Gfo/Idh/MocA family oxidoreductase [Clostridium swellfunianum]